MTILALPSSDGVGLQLPLVFCLFVFCSWTILRVLGITPDFALLEVQESLLAVLRGLDGYPRSNPNRPCARELLPYLLCNCSGPAQLPLLSVLTPTPPTPVVGRTLKQL